MKSKHIAISAWITLIASMVTGVKGYNDNLGIGLFFLNIVLVIVSITAPKMKPCAWATRLLCQQAPTTKKPSAKL